MKLKQRDRKVIAFELDQHHLGEEARKADDNKAHADFVERTMQDEFDKENRLSIIEGDKYRSGEVENPLEKYIKDVEMLWLLSRDERWAYTINVQILERGGNGTYLVNVGDHQYFMDYSLEDYAPTSYTSAM